MLPDDFQFTQSNLQDYLTCPRRFDLRYRQRLQWPAVQTAPVQESERRMKLGSDFHYLAHQHALGMPLPALTALAENDPSPELGAMWRSYLAHRPTELSAAGVRLFPEVTLATVLNGWRLAAKFDLLAAQPDGRVLIVDWKTNLRRPRSDRLRARAQSRVYPLVLAKAGESLLGQPVPADAITLVYWFTAAPADPEIIPYGAAQLAADESFLADLIARIAAADTFPLTDDDRPCRFCAFRSFCERGDVAGPLDEFEDDFAFDDFDLDWEQVSEIEF